MAEADAFDRFYRENLARIVRACLLVILDRPAAEDAAAEAFARLWSKWGQIQDDDHAGGFVFKTAMRVCRKEMSRRRRPVPVDETRGDWTDRVGIKQDVAAAIAGLSLRQRQAVVLRDWAGFETKEVARMLSMRESTVRVHLARARQHLRASLGAIQESAT